VIPQATAQNVASSHSRAARGIHAMRATSALQIISVQTVVGAEIPFVQMAPVQDSGKMWMAVV